LDGRDGLGAQQAVLQIGTNAIPTLLWMLRARDSAFKPKLIELAEKQRFIKINFVDAEKRNREAAGAFYLLGTTASNAVPALIRIYEKNISGQSRIATADALHFVGMAAMSAVPSLLHVVANTNDDAHVRCEASEMLIQLRAEPKVAVPVFIKCLKDSEPMVRGKAASALTSFGSDAKAAVPALIELRKDPDSNVRDIAALALKEIDLEAAAKAGIP
jgi:HEAT repeat protein